MLYTQIPGGWREGFGFIYGLILERNQKDGGEGTVLGQNGEKNIVIIPNQFPFGRC